MGRLPRASPYCDSLRRRGSCTGGSGVLPEIIVDLGKILLARYGTPGTRELCVGLEPLVLNPDAILVENHGVVTCGEDLTTAYHRMETDELISKVKREMGRKGGKAAGGKGGRNAHGSAHATGEEGAGQQSSTSTVGKGQEKTQTLAKT